MAISAARYVTTARVPARVTALWSRFAVSPNAALRPWAIVPAVKCSRCAWLQRDDDDGSAYLPKKRAHGAVAEEEAVTPSRLGEGESARVLGVGATDVTCVVLLCLVLCDAVCCEPVRNDNGTLLLSKVGSGRKKPVDGTSPPKAV